jgi:hypothetical protein
VAPTSGEVALFYRRTGSLITGMMALLHRNIQKLTITYKAIIKRIESQGFNIKIGTTSVQNLHLFEINNDLFWNFEDGTGKIYLNLKGEVVKDPFKSQSGT